MRKSTLVVEDNDRGLSVEVHYDPVSIEVTEIDSNSIILYVDDAKWLIKHLRAALDIAEKK